MEEEEEDLTYGEKVSQTYNLLGDKLKENPISNTLMALTGTSLGSTNLRPGVIGSATEAQMIKQGTANLANPAYRNLLGKSIVKQGGKFGIPATAALMAADVVVDKADKTVRSMEDMYDQAGVSNNGTRNIADQLRTLNLIEEQKAFDEGRPVFGEGEGITMGNIDEYFAANPDFSGIGDVTLPGEEPRVAPMVQQTTAAPTMEGIDYSSAFPGGQQQTPAPTAPMASRASRSVSDLIGFKPQFEGQTLGQFLRDEDSPAEATFQRLDPQGRLRLYTAEGELAPQYSAYEADSARQQEMLRNQPKRVGLGSEFTTGDKEQDDLSMSDYRNILRAQGVGGSAQIALAKQMMNEANLKKSETELKKSAAELNAEKIRAQIAKAKKEKEPRAKTQSEMQISIVNRMTELQAMIDAGETLTPEQQLEYNSGNAALQLFGGDYYRSPFTQPEAANLKTLPSASDPKGMELIEKMKKRYPESSEEEILKSLRSSNKLA